MEDSLEKRKENMSSCQPPPFLKLRAVDSRGMLSLMCHIEINIAKEKESRPLFHNTFTLQMIVLLVYVFSINQVTIPPL